MLTYRYQQSCGASVCDPSVWPDTGMIDGCRFRQRDHFKSFSMLLVLLRFYQGFFRVVLVQACSGALAEGVTVRVVSDFGAVQLVWTQLLHTLYSN